MDPRIIGPEQWIIINRIQPLLVLFVGMMVNGAISLLIAHAIVPSLIDTGDLPEKWNKLRVVLYPVSLVSMVLMACAFFTAVGLLTDVIPQIFPRYAI